MNSPISDPTISLALAPLAPPAGGPGPGTPDEAMAMVKRAQGKFRMAGAAATFTAINNQSDGFVDRDLYAFVYDLRGVSVAHGAHAELVGRNLIRLRDHGGRRPIHDMIEIARAEGSGWIEFRLINPMTNTIEARSAYLERMDGYVVGVGVRLDCHEAIDLASLRPAGDPASREISIVPAPGVAGEPAEGRIEGMTTPAAASAGDVAQAAEMSPHERLFTEFRRAKRLKIMKTNALRRRPSMAGAAMRPRTGLARRHF
jgi:cytochrome c